MKQIHVDRGQLTELVSAEPLDDRPMRAVNDMVGLNEPITDVSDCCQVINSQSV